ncbi:DUF4926 domain-containing protein [Spirosoma foliorum]|uniref:DUF4926 domain-containing protein n=1 Tax=Spirosoma foliorum TaxID=2710596 RepID=A0A7G5GNN8_9BACT|nr:DUF4926 domain-containing protein [Spirosoma foliorum]QMW00480.1 DUF4926 domain-containing protein [Spirosoma foliorum]
MDSLNLLDVVVLATDLPAEKLKKGSLGTIVEVFNNGDFLVEFANMNGITYALSTLSSTQLIKVYQEPIEA